MHGSLLVGFELRRSHSSPKPNNRKTRRSSRIQCLTEGVADSELDILASKPGVVVESSCPPRRVAANQHLSAFR